ncbi:MAG: lytic transglycosylase domain-containing protein [Chloroflexi bacterium]|nr:lytic transglycosylase domain-containing protein [Chloroflexota bacterium]
MNVQKAIFPGFAAGCILLIFISSLIANPGMSLMESKVAAAGLQQPAAAAANLQMAKPEGGEAVEQPAAGGESAGQELPPLLQTAVAEAVNPPVVESSCAISPSYPASIQQWCEWISKYARQHNLDPNLIAAVMLQESNGDARAYSKSGAVGLMQVMPRDGLAANFMCKNGPCFAERPSIEELYDPEFNISYGTSLLAGLIHRYGDVREALKAYGPMDMGYGYADIVLNIFSQHR